MIGAIAGDIIGSRFEWHPHKSTEFELFTEDNRCTDDTVMTLAVMKAILETEADYKRSGQEEKPHMDVVFPSEGGMKNANGDTDLSQSNGEDVQQEDSYYHELSKNAVHWMRKLGRKYPFAGYGGRFGKWLLSFHPKPYHSFGNGSAMRISPVGIAGRSLEETIRMSEAVSAVTHDHPEGIKGAEAVAVAMYLLRTGKSKEEVEAYISEHYYSMDFDLIERRETYQFDVSCQGSVPEALKAFFISPNYESTVRIAVSLGGDSDTQAAIAGSLAEVCYGVPMEIRAAALKYLDKYQRSIVEEFEERYPLAIG